MKTVLDRFDELEEQLQGMAGKMPRSQWIKIQIAFERAREAAIVVLDDKSVDWDKLFAEFNNLQ